uniref:Uncharacterized protein n=1 Tax=Moniliophthora roreri TaxID=221103 RepID=A0A0W0G5Z9_MONRR
MFFKMVRWANRVDYFGENVVDAGYHTLPHGDSLGIPLLGTVNYFPTLHYAFALRSSIQEFLHCVDIVFRDSRHTFRGAQGTHAFPEYRRMRTYTFFYLGFFNHVSESASLRWPPAEALAYIAGALMYAERCPEFLAPGYFDCFVRAPLQ